MEDTERIVFAVIVTTLLLVMMIAIMGILMVLNTNRRHRHRAELAEAERLRDAEVLHAEREAVQQTLREVGSELHDNVGQLLTVAQLGLNTALDDGPDARLAAARDAIDQGIEELRRLAHSLNSDLWQQRSLADAISAEAERIERVGRVRAHVVLRGMPPELPADQSILLFRVFQEVMNNALKHSGADTINIVLDGHDGPLFTITDNGNGFDAAQTNGHGGWVNIRRRCALIGFEAQCSSKPGEGCTWTIKKKQIDGA